MDKNHSNVQSMKPIEQPDSLKKHKQQAFLQIWLPLFLFVFLMAAAVVFIIVQSSTFPPQSFDYSLKWANISTMFLVIINLFFGLIVFAVIAAMVYGLAKAIKILPVYTKIGQKYIFTALYYMYSWIDKSAEPILRVNAWTAGGQTFISRLRNPNKQK